MAAARAKTTPEISHAGALAQGDLVSAYRIAALIGSGGMGWVYRADHALTGRTVALKILREDQVEHDRSVDRMMREATILASVRHPGLPRFYECGLLADGRPWIAMELITGTSLQARLALGDVTADEVIALLADVSDVLAAAHVRGVTHRDLKPDNIILTPADCRRRAEDEDREDAAVELIAEEPGADELRGGNTVETAAMTDADVQVPAFSDDGFPVRLIDWGIAHHVASARFTAMNEALGTPTYMSPEQARGGPTNGYCDVYGLGIVAYQAMSGRPPFTGQTSVEILVQHLNKPAPPLAPRAPDAPIALVELVERMLLKSTEERPSAAEVAIYARELQRARRGLPAVPHAIFEGNHTPVTAQLRVPRLPS